MPYTQERLLRMLADVITSQFPASDVELLLQAGVDPNGSVTHGLKPLHYAAFCADNCISYIDVLVENGAAVNCADDVGYSPLHVAAKAGHVDALRALIKYGADVNGRMSKEVRSRYSQSKPESEDETSDVIDENQNLQDNAQSARISDESESAMGGQLDSTASVGPVSSGASNTDEPAGQLEARVSPPLEVAGEAEPISHLSLSADSERPNTRDYDVRWSSDTQSSGEEDETPPERRESTNRMRDSSTDDNLSRLNNATRSNSVTRPVDETGSAAAARFNGAARPDIILLSVSSENANRLEHLAGSNSISRSYGESRSENGTRSSSRTRTDGETRSDSAPRSTSNGITSQSPPVDEGGSAPHVEGGVPGPTTEANKGEEEETSRSLAALADSPLCLAVEHDQVECAEILLRHGADPNIKSFLGHLINTVPLDSHQCLRLLLRHGANPDALSRGGMTALMRACKQKQVEAVKILVEYGANVNIQCPPRFDRRRAIHFATMVGSFEIVELLLKAGAYTWKPPGYSCAPLECAVVHDRVDICQLLLTHGADPNELNEDDCTPLQVACSAAGLRQQRLIIESLLRSGAQPNIHSPHFSYTGPSLCPLIEYLTYCEELDYSVVKSFLQHGAIVNFTVPTRLLRIQDARGALGQLRKLRPHDDVLALIIDAAGKFDRDAIGRDTSLANGQRTSLLEAASSPRSLAQTCRANIVQCVTEAVTARQAAARESRKAGAKEVSMADTYSSLPIPSFLQKYLLFDV